MKQQLVEWARAGLRLLPIPVTTKRQLQHLCFLHFPAVFRHLPAYQLWSLQHPSIAVKEIERLNLSQKRSETLSHGIYDAGGKSGILMISHSLGGGTEHHLQQLGKKLEEEGLRVWALRALGHQWVRLLPYDELQSNALVYHIENDWVALIEQLKLLNIRLIHVHHLVDFPASFCDSVVKMAGDLTVPYDFTVHDYLPICPRYTLYDEAVRGYCGEPDVKRCQGCVASFGSVAGKQVNVKIWRENYAAFLEKAHQVYTPDLDVKNRLERYLPHVNLQNRPHWDETKITPLPQSNIPATVRGGRALKVLTLGAIAPHKGSMILKECAEDARKRGLKLEFTLIGFSDIDWLLKKHMTVTGAYKPADLPQMLREGGFDIVFLPAVWPETFNYTLSEVLHFGLYPVSFDIGAIGRRIGEIGYGAVLPYELYRNPQGINDALLALKLPATVPVEKLQAAQMHYANILRDYYSLEIID